jgi:ribosome-associated protein
MSKNVNYNKLSKAITELMLDKKATEIQIINVSKLTSLTDYFIICSSDSEPKTKAIMNHIKDKVHEKYDIKPLHLEGIENLEWVLLDYVSIVVNIFSKEKREYYNIERLWADAKITLIKESFE